MGLRPVLQSDRNECGLVSLVMIARHHGYEIDLAGLRRRFPDYSPTLRSLIRCAAEIGLRARPVRLDRSELKRLALPALDCHCLEADRYHGGQQRGGHDHFQQC